MREKFIVDESSFEKDDDFSDLEGEQQEGYGLLLDSLDQYSGFGYTNHMGIRIPVSESHITHAIKFKQELQKSSPSMKCNWAQHKDLMEYSGFGVDKDGMNTLVDSSDTNENYRQMVKRAQKQRGLLPEVKEYADMLSNQKIKALHKKTGELYREKRALQNERREFNKAKREITDQSLLAEDIIHELRNLEFNSNFSNSGNIYSDEKLINDLIDKSSKGNVALIPASDWHIGQANRHMKLEDMEFRIALYVEQILKYAKKFDITDLYVGHLGDIINQHLHNNSGFYNELDIAEQIAHSFRLLTTFLDELSNHLNVIFLGVVNGNHDRLQSDKKSALYTDGVGKLLTSLIQEQIIKSNKQSLQVDLSGYTPDYIYHTIGNKHFYLEHGDKVSNRNNIQGRMAQINKIIDARVKGHIHNFRIISETNDKLDITSGSLNGSDEYANNLGLINSPSQLFIAVCDENIIPIDIKL